MMFAFGKSLGLRAFTLIELLIVVAIIAILAAIAVPNFLEAQTRSKVSRTMADMRSLATAIESYCVDTNHYPYGIGAYKSSPPASNSENAPLQVLTSPISYISTLPDHIFDEDPSTSIEDQPYQTFWYNNREYREAQGWAYPERWTERGWLEWVLFSCGPSGLYGTAGMGSGLGYPDEVQYDPSNGTVSLGGIFFGGPGGNNEM